MDTQRLRYFLAIADEGSINHAANILGIAQPALSRQIRLLEKEVGTPLFRRTARGVELTDAGRQLRATVAAPLRQLELSMIYVGSSFVRAERGLRLGLPVTAAGLLPLPVLDRLSAACPVPGVHVVIANNDELTAKMRDGTVDVAVMEPPLEGWVHYEDLLAEELVVVGGPDSALDPGRPVRFAELADHSLVCLSCETGILDSIEQTARRLKTRLTARYTTNSLELTRDLIASGHGYGVLPLSACGAEIAEQKLRYAPLRSPALTRQLGIAVTSQNQLRHGITATVSRIIREQAATLIQSGAWNARISLPVPDDAWQMESGPAMADRPSHHDGPPNKELARPTGRPRASTSGLPRAYLGLGCCPPDPRENALYVITAARRPIRANEYVRNEHVRV